MDFEKLYKKVKDGTATEEEKRLVEEEIRKAKEVTDILEEKKLETTPEAPAVTKFPDSEKFKEALSYFNFRQMIKTTIIIIIVLVSVAVIAFGSILGIAYYNAHQHDNVSEAKATEIARDYIAEYAETPVEKVIVNEVSSELDIKFHLTKSRYIYEIELTTPKGEYTVVVNAESGYPHIEDIDDRDRYDD